MVTFFKIAGESKADAAAKIWEGEVCGCTGYIGEVIVDSLLEEGGEFPGVLAILVDNNPDKRFFFPLRLMAPDTRRAEMIRMLAGPRLAVVNI